MRQLCTFDLLGNRYGVDLRYLRQVIDPVPVTPVPLAPEEICGMINLRGDLVSVCSLDQMLGLGETSVSHKLRRPRVIILESEPHRFATFVEAVDTLSIEEAEVLKIEDPGSIIEGMIPGEPCVWTLRFSGIIDRVTQSFANPEFAPVFYSSTPEKQTS